MKSKDFYHVSYYIPSKDILKLFLKTFLIEFTHLYSLFMDKETVFSNGNNKNYLYDRTLMKQIS